MDNLTDETLQSLQILTEAGLAIKVVPGGTIPVLVRPDGTLIESLEKYIYNDHQPNPERVRGTVSVLDAPSFNEYFKLFADANSRIFADETKAAVIGVLDYHESQGKPRWGQHRVSLTLRQSVEWTRWTSLNGKKFTQIEFAEFIEANSPDIIKPASATMLECARDLSAKTDVDFGSAVTIANGSVKLKYSEQVKATFGSGEVTVPETFTIAIPIHIGSERVEILARLRYRINAGKLTFWYDLHRADVAARQAFIDNVAEIAGTLAVTIINGTPA